jgi:hypothetical protein
MVLNFGTNKIYLTKHTSQSLATCYIYFNLYEKDKFQLSITQINPTKRFINLFGLNFLLHAIHVQYKPLAKLFLKLLI